MVTYQLKENEKVISERAPWEQQAFAQENPAFQLPPSPVTLPLPSLTIGYALSPPFFLSFDLL